MGYVTSYLDLDLDPHTPTGALGNETFPPTPITGHWPLCEHHTNWLVSPVNLSGIFVAKSFLDILFFPYLHWVLTA